MPPLEEAAKSAYYGNSRLMRGLPGRSGRQSRTSFNSVDYSRNYNNNKMGGGMALKVRKAALVIGNSSYTKTIELDSPRNDANAVSGALKSLGYDVLLQIDLDYAATGKTIREFLAAVQAASLEVCLFYYSGYWLQIRGTNFIVPVDFDTDLQQPMAKLVSIQAIMEALIASDCVRIILLDACRTGTTTEEREQFQTNFRDRLANKGIDVRGDRKTILVDGDVLPRLAEMKAEDNTFIAYATAQGRVAKAGVSGSLSPFAAALVKYMPFVDLPLSSVTSLVRREVLKSTHGEQSTWDQSSLAAPFYFNDRPYPLIAANTIIISSLILSLIPLWLVLTSGSSEFWVLLSMAPPLISFAILLAAMQSAYSRLRGQFFSTLESANNWRDHAVLAWRKGVVGGFLGAPFAALLIAVPYYWAWQNATSTRPYQVDRMEPLGKVMVEFTYAAILGVCISAFLTLFFARVRVRRWKLALSPTPGAPDLLAGSGFGGILAGVIIGPVLTAYFGRLARPELTPEFLLPGVIFSSVIVVYYIVNAQRL